MAVSKNPFKKFKTRMHCSRMGTARSLTVSRSICHVCPPETHTPHAMHVPPAMHAPCHTRALSCTPPAMHDPTTHAPTTHTPCHTCPPPCMPPCMQPPTHAPLPSMPPTMHAPCHACPPAATYAPHACPPPLWTEFLTHASENITHYSTIRSYK